LVDQRRWDQIRRSCNDHLVEWSVLRADPGSS
jgi:hypothetical protein